MTDPIVGRIRHRTHRRVRIELAAPLPPRSRLEALAEAVAGIEGVAETEIRPTTGSLVIHHTGEFAPIRAGLHAAGLSLGDDPHGGVHADPVTVATFALAQANAALSRLSDGRADLRGLAFTGLLAAGLLQLARGQIAGPALTLFSQAATLMPTKREPGSET